MRKQKRGKVARIAKWLALVLVVAVLGVLAWPNISGMFSGNAQNTAQRTMGNVPNNLGANTQTAGSFTPVTRGNITKTVYGSGNLSPALSKTVYSEVQGAVESVKAEVGDEVKQGDEIIMLQSDELDSEIASLESALFASQNTLAAIRDSGSTSTIVSPAAGRVKMVNVKEDDDIAMAMKLYGSLMVISRDGKMRVEFTPAPGTNLNVGDPVTVWIDGEGVSGVVDQVTGLKGDVAVTIDDDEYDVAKNVLITTPQGTQVGSGALQVNMPIPVTGTGGTVSKVYKSDNDTVSSGTSLIYVTGRIPSNELTTAYLAYEEARIALENAQKKRDSLVIRAPIDGVITELNASDGAAIAENAAAFKIQSNTSFNVKASVDELDIATVAIGQKVDVEFDAYPNRVFTGEVSRISGVGSVSGGVATYEVTVRIDESEGLRDGMTASADIVVADKQNVLVVPVEAISTSNGQSYVTLASGQRSNVTIGVSDESYTEILSGVNEGDSVLVTRSSSSSNNGNGMFFSTGGGGAMPAMQMGNGGGTVIRGGGGF